MKRDFEDCLQRGLILGEEFVMEFDGFDSWGKKVEMSCRIGFKCVLEK